MQERHVVENGVPGLPRKNSFLFVMLLSTQILQALGVSWICIQRAPWARLGVKHDLIILNLSMAVPWRTWQNERTLHVLSLFRAENGWRASLQALPAKMLAWKPFQCRANLPSGYLT